ncbi:hypothetical protein MATL_G00106270 [Megalops atlanticus]|uniref:Kelch domain-containing protein 7A n=1 Tax=Megalops atlanticus TaxID=7932 RepID=A0A9D3PZW5_MEGAT|nr:hypothetical protein MATL_G00106270 [Megalops atlanticus]
MNHKESEENSSSCTLSAQVQSPPPSNESGQMSPTGQRSLCMLRKFEPSTGVSRELRQDLEHPGTFSSFQSKVEITVEDGDLLLDRPGDTPVEVRGKIYDYYAESSSQSISDNAVYATGVSGPIARRYDDSVPQDSQLIGLSGRLARGGDSCGGSRGAEPLVLRSCASPLIMRDLIPPQDPGFPSEDSHSSITAEPASVDKLELTQNDGRLQMAESTEIPFLRFGASTPGSSKLGSRTPSSEDLCPSSASPVHNPMILSESTAGVNFSQTPAESIDSSELESLLGQLDLGNCLQALSLAREHSHAALEEAALKVMSDNYLLVLRDPRLYGRLKATDRDLIQKQRMRGKQYLMVAAMDPQDWTMAESSTPESAESRTSSGLYCYDDYKDTWCARCSLPKEVVSMGCAMCTMDNYLFAAVGCQGTDHHIEPSRKVFCYNPKTDIWKEICPMNEARPLCKLVALQGYIYAIGGECLYTVERYDPRADRWTFVAPLPNDTFAVAHCATACNGELFVSGGTLRYTLLRYNPKTDTWKQSVITGNKERTTAMVAVRNFLYRFDVNPILGISVYRYHTMARLWYECCSKRLPYCSTFQCTVMDDVIYCINRQFTMRLLADEVSPVFVAEDLKVLSEAKGVLFPFTLVLPDKETIQTSV